MSELLLFGGTTEGRLLAEYCTARGIPVTVSVATQEGAALLPEGVRVLCGRLEMPKMRAILESGQFSRVIDATHPYAAEVTANLRTVCGSLDVPYTRLVREHGNIAGDTVPDMNSLIEYLNAWKGAALSTLGSKSLPALTQVHDFRERLWVRVLLSDEITGYCEDLGYDAAHVIAEKPPFSVEQNLAHLRRSGASLLVTKESGSAGGYPEKCEAARILGIPIVTLCRPAEEGLTLSQVKLLLKEEWA